MYDFSSSKLHFVSCLVNEYDSDGDDDVFVEVS